MTNSDMLRRILDEAMKLGGPKELVRQYDLNRTLEERGNQLSISIEARQRTIAQTDERIRQRTEADRISQQAHENHLAHMAAEKKQKTDQFNAELAQQKEQLDQGKSEIYNMNQEKQKISDEITIGKWLMAVVRRNPEALRLVRLVASLMEHEQTSPVTWTDTLAYKLITLARREMTDLGLLVPKRELDEVKNSLALTKLQSMNDRSILNRILDPVSKFNKYPMRMTTDQKKVFIETYVQTGSHTQEGFAQLVKRLKASEKCVIHGTEMEFDYQLRKWICPTLNCTFRR